MKPPKNLKGEELFRKLSELPRPTKTLEYRIRGAPDVELSIRGLSSAEFYRAKDQASGGSKFEPHIVAAALLADGELAFENPKDIFSLDEGEVMELYGAVFSELSGVSPIFSLVDGYAWTALLVEGAKHVSNIYTAHAMSHCVHLGGNLQERTTTLRPDLYYGVPIVELTDGQLMAFYAAKQAIDDIREKPEEK